MQAFKLFLKMFIGGPLIVVACFALLGTLIGGEYLYAVGIVVLLIAYFAFWGWDEQRDARKLREAVQARGLNLDYFVNYLDGGVVIDLANEKVLVGNLKAGVILSFAEVKSVEWEDTPFKGKMKHNLYVNTHSFDNPRVGAGFAGNKSMRDTAYAKLSAALKLS
jgi:hypothetical protein